MINSGNTFARVGETLLVWEFPSIGEIPLEKLRIDERLTAGESTEKPVPMLGVDVVEKESVVVVEVDEEEEAHSLGY